MGEVIPGLTEEETKEFRELMTPKVGPKLTEQARLNRVSRLRDLQAKMGPGPQQPKQQPQEEGALQLKDIQTILHNKQIHELEMQKARRLRDVEMLNRIHDHMKDNPQDKNARKAYLYNLMKLDDPHSVVRDSDFEDMSDQEVDFLLNKILRGE
jgi:hypothetical protein